jgi:hypothetical protein
MKNRPITAMLLAVVALTAAPGVVSAQGGPGFLFQQPRISVAVRTGYQLPRAGSDIFDFPRDSLTLSTSDFASPYWGAEVAIRLTDRLDLALGGGWARSRSRSEYRDWVDQDGNPIEQSTRFQTISGTLGAKLYLGDRGRSIGRFAWVPERVTPYVGAGFGAVSYEFKQWGDWVDVGDPELPIVFDRLSTTGSGAAGYLSFGADVALGKLFLFNGEARYTLASGQVGGSYRAFDRIDLAGAQLLAGLAIRF